MPVPGTTHKVANFVAFQASWFACVLGAANDAAWVGPAVVASALTLHLAWSARPASQAVMVTAVAALGYAADSALTAAGVLRFPGDGLLAPPWIAALWVAFATTLDCSMRWLRRRWLLGALLGAAAGPLCYLAGARLGALALHPENTRFAVSVALAWGLALPAGLWIVERTVDS